MSRALTHPRMLAHVTDTFFPHNVAFQTDTGTANSSGQHIENWTYVAGLTAVPCRIGPISTAQEQKMAEYVTTGADSVILIVGVWDDMLTTSMRLVASDGKEYDVLAVETDSARTVTRIMARTRT